MRVFAMFLSLLAATACSSSRERDGDRCDQAVAHVAGHLRSLGPPSKGEDAIMQVVETAARERCRAEGLSDAQLRCILATRDLSTFDEVWACPAIAERRPGWLVAGGLQP
jgi:hypothetical protein